MNTRLATFIASVKKMSPSDFFYPGVLFVFFIIIFIIFLIATGFISKNINRAITSEERVESYSLNTEDYALVAKRLHIASSTGATNDTGKTMQSTEATTTSTVQKETPALDKTSLSITILNSTAKKGVAGTLAKALETAGYAKSTTGNEKTPYRTTTVIVKEGKSAYSSLILEEVQKYYPNAVASTTPYTAPFDVTIIIGEN